MKIAYDFHLHSCLSLCAADDCTPSAIAGMSAISGLDTFALSDHQSALNCPAAEAAAKEYGLLFIAGMELMTVEEVHILCLFESTERALDFSEYVRRRLTVSPPAHKKNWRQTVMDMYDNPIGEEERWLGSPADIGIYGAAEAVRSFGGLAIPAHIDRPSYSLLSNLGMYDPDMGFELCEISSGCDEKALLCANPQLAGMPFIRNSDAHDLIAIPDAQNYIEIEEKTPAAVLAALRALKRGIKSGRA